VSIPRREQPSNVHAEASILLRGRPKQDLVDVDLVGLMANTTVLAKQSAGMAAGS
jgi:hypothetical protein